MYGSLRVDKQLYASGTQLPAFVPGSVWYVNVNVVGSGDGKSWATAFKTVQEAVNASGDRTADMILVAPGKIQENVLIEKTHDALYLKAVAGPWETQWRGGDATTKHTFTDTNGEASSATSIALFVGARNVTVDGFCFDGSDGNTVGLVVGDGYGVGDVTQGTSQNSASCRVINCLFDTDNAGTGLPGLVLKGCSANVIVENNVFRKCDIGIYIASGSGKTNQGPIIRFNHFQWCSTYGVLKANESTDIGVQVIGNTFLDGPSSSMTYAVKFQGTGCHFVGGNLFGCANTFSAAATDFQSGNCKPVAGNSVTYVEMEA
jgi:parallel beta-helix repeat protein